MVAGGTGGHIMPAIALGLFRKSCGDSVGYVCGSRPLELEIYDHHGIEPLMLPVQGSPLGTRRPLVVIQRFIAVFLSFFVAIRIIIKESPDVILLFGGYVSLPVLLVGILMGKKLVWHEQNAVAGKVTRLAYRLGVTIATGWRRCDGVRGVFTGIPVRDIRHMTRSEALSELELDETPLKNTRIVSVLGGSLGSSSLMDSILSRTCMVKSAGYVWICPGSKVCPSSRYILGVPQSWDMSAIYTVSDLVVCRGGGSTLAEVSSYGVPAIVVPWQGASDGHQEANAMCFVNSRSPGEVWDENDGLERLFCLVEKLSSLSRSPMCSDREAICRLWRLVLSRI